MGHQERRQMCAGSAHQTQLPGVPAALSVPGLRASSMSMRPCELRQSAEKECSLHLSGQPPAPAWSLLAQKAGMLGHRPCCRGAGEQPRRLLAPGSLLPASPASRPAFRATPPGAACMQHTGMGHDAHPCKRACEDQVQGQRQPGGDLKHRYIRPGVHSIWQPMPLATGAPSPPRAHLQRV